MAGTRRRRHWDDEEKRRIVAQTQVPGVSVSQVARRYDVNANLVFNWRRDPRFQPASDSAPHFLAVELAPAGVVSDDVACRSDGGIEITLGNGIGLTLSGEFDAAAVCRLVRGLR